jgi:IPT/TIG domain
MLEIFTGSKRRNSFLSESPVRLIGLWHRARELVSARKTGEGVLIVRRVQAAVVVVLLVALIALATGCGASKPALKSVAPKEGFPGTGFKITGTDFGESQGKSTVHLGSTAVKATSWSATGVTANVPAGTTAGSYGVTVTTGGGTSNKISFTVSASFSAASPLPAMQNYLKSKGVDTTGMSFAVVTTSKVDSTWKMDQASGTSQPTAYFLFHKDASGWTIVDYAPDFTAAQLKADGAPSDISPTVSTGSSSSSPSSSSTK